MSSSSTPSTSSGPLTLNTTKDNNNTTSSSNIATNNSVLYQYKSTPDDTQIQVQIIDAKGLYKCDLFGISPYATVYSAEENLPRCKTKVHKKTCNPKFNEMLQFDAPNWRKPSPKPMSIRIELFAHNKSDRHEFLGHATVHFRDHKSLYTASGKWVELWLKLEKKMPKQKVTGDVHVAIRCMDSTDREKRASVSMKQLNLAQEYRKSMSLSSSMSRKSGKQGKTSSNNKIDIEKSSIQFESNDRILKTDLPHKFTVWLRDAKSAPITEGLINLEWSIVIVNVLTGDVIDTDAIERSIAPQGGPDGTPALEFEYCPTEAGDYTVSVTINEMERLIPQRFEVVPVVDASNTHLYGSLIERGVCLDSEQCEFMLSLRDKRNNPIYVTANTNVARVVKALVRRSEETNPFVPCIVTHVGESNFKVHVLSRSSDSTPLPIGDYLVTVEVAGVALADPVVFRIIKTTSLENTQILNLPPFKKIMTPFTFVIMACDVDGNPKEDGGDDFTVEITNKNNNERINSFVTDLNDGKYAVSSILPEVDQYQISVLLAGKHVHTMSITGRQTISPYHCIVSQIPRSVPVGSQIEFTIHMKDIHGNPAYLDDEADVFEVAVLNNFDGNYLDMDTVQIEEIATEGGDAFKIVAPLAESAQYIVDLKLNDEPLGNIPAYTVDVHSGVIEPQNTVFKGPGIKKAYISNTLTGLTIQLQDVSGLRIPYAEDLCKIEASVKSRSGATVPIEYAVKSTDDETALLEYKLTDGSLSRGLYTLNVSMDGQLVKSFPISVVESTSAPNAASTEFFGLFDESGKPVSGSIDTLYSFKLKLNQSESKPQGIGNDFVVIGFTNKTESRASIVDLQNGTYAVNWTPKEEGDYKVSVSINGTSVPLSNNTVHIAKKEVSIVQVINRSFEVCTFDTTGEPMNDTIGSPENLKHLTVVFDREDEQFSGQGEEEAGNALSIAHSIAYIGGGKFRVQFLSLAKPWSGTIKVFHKESMIGNIKYSL